MCVCVSGANPLSECCCRGAGLLNHGQRSALRVPLRDRGRGASRRRGEEVREDKEGQTGSHTCGLPLPLWAQVAPCSQLSPNTSAPALIIITLSHFPAMASFPHDYFLALYHKKAVCFIYERCAFCTCVCGGDVIELTASQTGSTFSDYISIEGGQVFLATVHIKTQLEEGDLRPAGDS